LFCSFNFFPPFGLFDYHNGKKAFVRSASVPSRTLRFRMSVVY
jgi:hypothetical protein